MRFHQVDRKVETTASLDFLDITGMVNEAIVESAVTDGQVTVFCTETGCTLLINERESGLLSDIRAALDRLEAQDVHSRHALLGSTSIVLPVVEGALRLGTWQRVMLAELEHAGFRSIVIQVVGA